MSDWEGLKIGLPGAHGIATYPAGATFGPRLMRDWEFVWIVEGDAVYRRRETSPRAVASGRATRSRDIKRLESERLEHAPAGSIVLCRPNATDGFAWDEKKRTRHAFFHFRIASLPPFWPDAALWPLVRTPREGDLLRPLFRHVLACATSNDNRKNRGTSLEGRLGVAHLLASFVSGNIESGDVPHTSWPDAVERVWRAIHERVEESKTPLSLGELGIIACATPEHLCRVFKAATGWTPMEAQRLARLDRAATLLFRSNYGVAEIAVLCGFANAFHFSRRFKEAYGQAPRELRQAVRQGQTPPLPRLLQNSRFQLPP